jgi:hypothetical protein
MIKRASSGYLEMRSREAGKAKHTDSVTARPENGKQGLLRRFNKAETATIHRLSRLFDAVPTPEGRFDLSQDRMTIHVITTARLSEAVEAICHQQGRAFVALTNKDGVEFALQTVTEPRVGIMDPYGNIVRDCIGETL